MLGEVSLGDVSALKTVIREVRSPTPDRANMAAQGCGNCLATIAETGFAEGVRTPLLPEDTNSPVQEGYAHVK